MSLLSYAVAVSRHPIRPDQTFAPPDARPLLPDDALPPSYAAAAAAGDEEDDIPLRVLRNARHGGAGASGSRARRGRRDAEDAEYSEEGAEEDADADEDAEEDAALLGKEGEDDEPGTAPTVLMAKGGTGGPRWCRKCDGWKPDRCHHCRACRQCVLKSRSLASEHG
jgi:hypothetical protein